GCGACNCRFAAEVLPRSADYEPASRRSGWFSPAALPLDAGALAHASWTGSASAGRSAASQKSSPGRLGARIERAAPVDAGLSLASDLRLRSRAVLGGRCSLAADPGGFRNRLVAYLRSALLDAIRTRSGACQGPVGDAIVVPEFHQRRLGRSIWQTQVLGPHLAM